LTVTILLGRRVFPVYQEIAKQPMPLNKKQKKQLDLEHKKLAQLRQQLAGAKKQLDDPAEVARLEQEIAGCVSRIDRLKQES